MLRPASPTSTVTSDDEVDQRDPVFATTESYEVDESDKGLSSSSSSSSVDDFDKEAYYGDYDSNEEMKEADDDDYKKLDLLVERIESRRETSDAISESIELTTLDDEDVDPESPTVDDTDDDSDKQSLFREDALFLELRRSQLRQTHQAWIAPPPPDSKPPTIFHTQRCKVFACW